MRKVEKQDGFQLARVAKHNPVEPLIDNNMGMLRQVDGKRRGGMIGIIRRVFENVTGEDHFFKFSRRFCQAGEPARSQK